MHQIVKHKSEGRVIDEIIVNQGDLEVRLLDYGATLTGIKYKGVQMVLGYHNVTDYIADNMYLGKSVGRFAGRIAGGKYAIDGKTYKLTLNDGDRTLHGGKNALSETTFLYEIEDNIDKTTIVFSIFNQKDKSGFNSTITLLINYSIYKNGSIIVRYKYKTNEKTVVNLTNHSYFTMGLEPTIEKLRLTLNANQVYRSQNLIPDGQLDDIKPYEDVALKRVIADYQGNLDNAFKLNDGYVGTLTNPENHIKLDIYSSYPCCVIYGCTFPREIMLKNGKIMQKYAAITMECQYPPNEINFKNVAIGCLVDPNKWYSNYIVYRFAML